MKRITKNLRLDNKGKSPAYYLKKNINSLSKKTIKSVNNFSQKNKIDARICLHSNVKDKVQLMINSLQKKKKYFYNYHPLADEYYYILQGKLLINYFEKNKKKKQILQKGKIEFFKLKKNILHVTIPFSKNCMYLEIREGPFDPTNDAIFSKKNEIIK